MEFIRNEMDWQLKSGGHTILDCKIGKPAIYVGYGEESVDMYRGNYKIGDYVVERCPLSVTKITEGPEGICLDMEGRLQMNVKVEGECATLSFERADPRINRFWFRVDCVIPIKGRSLRCITFVLFIISLTSCISSSCAA